jgi:hypothetical protein
LRARQKGGEAKEENLSRYWITKEHWNFKDEELDRRLENSLWKGRGLFERQIA